MKLGECAVVSQEGLVVNGDLQFATDILLIDKISTIEAGLYKKADLGSLAVDTVRSMASSLINEVKGRLKDEGPFAVVTWALMARSNMFIKLIMILAEELGGFTVGSILDSMFNSIKKMVQNGESISPSHINQMGKSALDQISDSFDAEDVSFSNDLLYDLRAAEHNGDIVKLARGGVFRSLFKVIGKRKSKRIIVGLVTFFVKAVLYGAGMFAVGSTAKKLISDDKKEDAGSVSQKKLQNKVQSLSWVPPKVSHQLTQTGKGQTYFVNDGLTKVWSVPLNGNLRNVMAMWSGYVYKELSGKNNLIMNTPAFNIMVSNLSKYVEPSGHFITIPPNFHSIKEIVDCFAGQTARKLKR